MLRIGVRDVLARHLHLALDHDLAEDVLALRVLLHLGQDFVVQRILIRELAAVRLRRRENFRRVRRHELELQLRHLGQNLFRLADLGALQSGDLDLQPVCAFGQDADFAGAERVEPLADDRDGLVERLRTRVALHLQQKLRAALKIEAEPDRLVDAGRARGRRSASWR